MAYNGPKKSYLVARDPSLSINLHSIRKLTPDLMAEATEDLEEEESRKLDIFLRLKPTTESDILYEVKGNTIKCNVPMDSQSARNLKATDQSFKFYTYTKIFPADTTQIEIFDHVVKGKVLKFINGENCNLLTYGTSGSGKTFTIVGTKENPGMIPQSLEYLFRSLPELSSSPTAKPTLNHQDILWLSPEEKTRESIKFKTLITSRFSNVEHDVHTKTYIAMQKRLSQQNAAILENLGSCIDIWISFAEIYNEQVFDLLECSGRTPRKKLKVFNNNGETYINNLNHIYVSRRQEAYLVLQYGLANLTYASTVLNPHSSRSHCIFTITMIQSTTPRSNKYHVSRINFCDLAGSERSKLTNNVGSRLNEANKINSSLLVLGRFISSIRKSQKNTAQRALSFRDSKLTQLLQKGLMGKEDISMIVNINQEKFVFDETKRALEFSTIASGITLNKSSNHPLQKLFRLDECKREEYKSNISDLLLEIEQQREHYADRKAEIKRIKVTKYAEHYQESRRKMDQDLYSQLKEKDKIIFELVEQINSKQNSNASVISISSSDDEDLNESVADLSVGTISCRKKLLERYQELFENHDKTILNQMVLERKLEELQDDLGTKTKELQKKRNTVEELNKELNQQCLEIERLHEECEKLDSDVCQSIKECSNIVITLEGKILHLNE